MFYSKEIEYPEIKKSSVDTGKILKENNFEGCRIDNFRAKDRLTKGYGIIKERTFDFDVNPVRLYCVTLVGADGEKREDLAVYADDGYIYLSLPGDEGFVKSEQAFSSAPEAVKADYGEGNITVFYSQDGVFEFDGELFDKKTDYIYGSLCFCEGRAYATGKKGEIYFPGEFCVDGDGGGELWSSLDEGVVAKINEKCFYIGKKDIFALPRYWEKTASRVRINAFCEGLIPQSAVETGEGVMFLADDGVYLFDGKSFNLLRSDCLFKGALIKSKYFCKDEVFYSLKTDKGEYISLFIQREGKYCYRFTGGKIISLAGIKDKIFAAIDGEKRIGSLSDDGKYFGSPLIKDFCFTYDTEGAGFSLLKEIYQDGEFFSVRAESECGVRKFSFNGGKGQKIMPVKLKGGKFKITISGFDGDIGYPVLIFNKKEN